MFQTSTFSSENIIDNIIYIKEELPESPESNPICHTTRTSCAQTDLVQTHDKMIQVMHKRDSPMTIFEKSIADDEKKCLFYTSLRFEKIETLHRFVNPTCEHDYTSLERQQCKFTSLQQLILLLVRLRMGYLIEDLAYRFDVSGAFVCKVFTKWMNILYKEFNARLKSSIVPSKKGIAKRFRLFSTPLPLNMETPEQDILFVCACLANFERL